MNCSIHSFDTAALVTGSSFGL